MNQSQRNARRILKRVVARACGVDLVPSPVDNLRQERIAGTKQSPLHTGLVNLGRGQVRSPRCVDVYSTRISSAYAKLQSGAL